MIVISKPRLRFLRNGRHLTVEDINPARYRTDRTYAVSTAHNKTSVCRVEIIGHTPTSIRIRLATIDPPRLLAANPGALRQDYTDNPSNAMWNEPEAVSSAEQERISKDAQARARSQVVVFKAGTLEQIDQLAIEADAVTKRRLRNMRRITSSL